MDISLSIASGLYISFIHTFFFPQGLNQLTSDNEFNEEGSEELSCLVAIGRLQPTSMPTSKDLIEAAPATEFITRQSLDGTFSFVDQR